MDLILIDVLIELQSFLSVCVGERAVALSGKDCTKLLLRAALSIPPWSTCRANDARYTE